MTLTSVQYSNEAGPGKWLQIDQELETRNGQTVGTSRPTGHSVLVDVRFELPYDAQGADAEELQAKLQALNRLIEIGVSVFKNLFYLSLSVIKTQIPVRRTNFS
ncbi:unnamed protein product [Gongylonema pulchrum]|uniref:YicC_N domain-containing protein n=1 Tax=Gongylonema pulchrum TaxID=637853 RepID=A0A183CWL0_9BILA|nr:unnamed protein product [Gongylonema pulchrum]